MSAVITEDEYLECSPHYHSSIDDCFTPCGPSSSSSPGQINSELDGVIPPFCAGHSGGSSGPRIFFTDPADNISYVKYTKEQVDSVLEKINGYYSKCGTNGHRWYWYLFAFKLDGENITLYQYRVIGK